METPQKAAKRPTAPCALCRNTAPLCHSHIIPEFLFEALYDDGKHRFHEVEIGADRARFQQKGMREYLLCEDCEVKFSVWERYARGVLVGGEPLTFTREGNFTWVSGLDYNRFKLFKMSILWRAGVSCRSDFFAKVKLGPHQEKLRKMLVVSDPGPPWRYGCFLAGAKIGQRPSTGLMIAPVPIRLGEVAGVRFVFGGLTWGFLVCGHKPPASITNTIMQRDGRLPLINGDLEQAPFYQAMMARHHRTRS